VLQSRIEFELGYGFALVTLIVQHHTWESSFGSVKNLSVGHTIKKGVSQKEKHL
jgi:hypothetical protein